MATMPSGKTKTIKKLGIITLALIIILAALASGFVFLAKPISFVVMGVEGTRTDSIIYLRIDTARSRVDAINIPRDTYHPVDGYNGLGQKKINAVYGFEAEGGEQRVKSAISNLLNVEIDYFVMLTYENVQEIVNMVGGVEIDVPMAMHYYDPYAVPPLNISFEPGLQRIMGEQAMSYLRFRSSSDGSYSGGDLERIKRQQDFIKQLSKSFLETNMLKTIPQAIRLVKTDISGFKALVTALRMLTLSADSIHMHSLPEDYVGYGTDGLSYFFHDPEKTKELMESIK